VSCPAPGTGTPLPVPRTLATHAAARPRTWQTRAAAARPATACSPSPRPRPARSARRWRRRRRRRRPARSRCRRCRRAAAARPAARAAARLPVRHRRAPGAPARRQRRRSRVLRHCRSAACARVHGQALRGVCKAVLLSCEVSGLLTLFLGSAAAAQVAGTTHSPMLRGAATHAPWTGVAPADMHNRGTEARRAISRAASCGQWLARCKQARKSRGRLHIYSYAVWSKRLSKQGRKLRTEKQDSKAGAHPACSGGAPAGPGLAQVG